MIRELAQAVVREFPQTRPASGNLNAIDDLGEFGVKSLRVHVAHRIQPGVAVPIEALRGGVPEEFDPRRVGHEPRRSQVIQVLVAGALALALRVDGGYDSTDAEDLITGPLPSFTS